MIPASPLVRESATNNTPIPWVCRFHIVSRLRSISNHSVHVARGFQLPVECHGAWDQMDEVRHAKFPGAWSFCLDLANRGNPAAPHPPAGQEVTDLGWQWSTQRPLSPRICSM